MENILIKIRNLFIILWSRLRLAISIEIRNKRPVLVVSEKYEKVVKWSLRIVTIVSVGSSLFIFPSLIYSFIFAIFLFLIEQFLEIAVFTFEVFYIQPIPNWRDYNDAEWNGMAFILPVQGRDEKGKIIIRRYEPYRIGMVFTGDEGAARRVFNTIAQWNNFNSKDLENNIEISFVIENDGTYTTYIQPSLQRKKEEDFEMFIKKEEKITGKEARKLLVQMTFAKSFALKDSNFESFKDLYRQGEYFYFIAYFVPKNKILKFKKAEVVPGGMVYSRLKPVKGTPYIFKNRLKIKKWNNLTREDLEYQHRRLIMGKW